MTEPLPTVSRSVTPRYPSLAEALCDLRWFEPYCDLLWRRSPETLEAWLTTHLAALDHLDSPANVRDWVKRLRDRLRRHGADYVPRPLALAAELAWPLAIDRFVTWDQQAHRRQAPGTIAWAKTLRDRALLWLLFVTALEPRSLLALDATAPNIERNDRGCVVRLVLSARQMTPHRPVVVSLEDDFEGVRNLLTAWVDRGRPLLVGQIARPSLRLFPAPRGGPLSPPRFCAYFAAVLRPQIFGALSVYPDFLRHVGAALLHRGYGVPIPALAARLGATEECARQLDSVFTPNAIRFSAECGARPNGVAPEPALATLRQWLAVLAREFAP
jgi:hypothetical protein